LMPRAATVRPITMSPLAAHQRRPCSEMRDKLARTSCRGPDALAASGGVVGSGGTMRRGMTQSLGRRNAKPEAAHGGDEAFRQLAAQAPDEHVNGVAVAFGVLFVEAIGEVGAREHGAGVVH